MDRGFRSPEYEKCRMFLVDVSQLNWIPHVVRLMGCCRPVVLCEGEYLGSELGHVLLSSCRATVRCQWSRVDKFKLLEKGNARVVAGYRPESENRSSQSPTSWMPCLSLERSTEPAQGALAINESPRHLMISLSTVRQSGWSEAPLVFKTRPFPDLAYLSTGCCLTCSGQAN